jgi:hypothetical protein
LELGLPSELIDLDYNFTTPENIARTEQIKRIAGDGDLDDRCRRILGALRESWCGEPYRYEEEEDDLMSRLMGIRVGTSLSKRST